MSEHSEYARASLQSNPRLRLEMLAAISKVFRENGVEISEEFLSVLVLAEPGEVAIKGPEPSIDPKASIDPKPSGAPPKRKK